MAHTGDEAIALVPLPARPVDPGGTTASDGRGILHADALLAVRTRTRWRPASADDGRLTLGVSAAVHSAEGLRGALEEARHARRVAAARPGRVCAAGHQELASHVLLLPFVPDDVRRAFTARLLDPLRDYDRRHRAELIPTLEAFLDCDGSWTRCADPAAPARQHAALPGGADRAVDGPRPVPAGGQAGLLPGAADELTAAVATSGRHPVGSRRIRTG